MNVFEGFTVEAGQVAVRAQTEARSLKHDWVGAEHLLLAVLAELDTPAVTVLTRFGITAEKCRAAIMELVGAGGFSVRESDALRMLGIDLDEVRRRVEAHFGAGALEFQPQTRRRTPWRRSCDPGPGNPFGFTPRAKRALELARREAQAMQDRWIGVDHILLGLLDPKGNFAVDLLRYLGADPDVVRTRLRVELGKAA